MNKLLSFVTKLKIKRSTSKTKKVLINKLCNPKNDFTWEDLHKLYMLLENSGGSTFMTPMIAKKFTEVHIYENSVDYWVLDIKHIISNTEVKMRIVLTSKVAEITNTTDNGISMKVETYSGDSIKRKILERNFDFVGSISFDGLISQYKTPKVEKELIFIKRVLASAFEGIIDYMIDWKSLS